jgi:hypothetical protein
MYRLTHLFSWIFISLTQVLRWIELSSENEVAEPKPQHRCDIPDDSIPPLFDEPEPQPYTHGKTLLAEAEAAGRSFAVVCVAINLHLNGRLDPLRPRCPSYGRAFELFKHRTEFDVYRCPNLDCAGR